MECVYCLETRKLRDEQVLVRGESFYLCAPLGQLVEGYLVIAPYRCIGCMAFVSPAEFDELDAMAALVSRFYASEYSVECGLVYEQGRGGSGTRVNEAEFPHHAHLCFLPVDVDLRSSFPGFVSTAAMLNQIPVAAQGRPYAFAGTLTGGPVIRGVVYTARTDAHRRALERLRLKPAIATLLGVPERGYWKDYPGEHQLHCVIERFSAFNRRRLHRQRTRSHV